MSLHGIPPVFIHHYQDIFFSSADSAEWADKFEEIIRPKSDNNCLSVAQFLHLMQSELNTKWRNISTRQPSYGE